MGKKKDANKDSFFNNEKGFGVKEDGPEQEGFVHFSNIATDGVKAPEDGPQEDGYILHRK